MQAHLSTTHRTVNPWDEIKMGSACLSCHVTFLARHNVYSLSLGRNSTHPTTMIAFNQLVASLLYTRTSRVASVLLMNAHPPLQCKVPWPSCLNVPIVILHKQLPVTSFLVTLSLILAFACLKANRSEWEAASTHDSEIIPSLIDPHINISWIPRHCGGGSSSAALDGSAVAPLLWADAVLALGALSWRGGIWERDNKRCCESWEDTALRRTNPSRTWQRLHVQVLYAAPGLVGWLTPPLPYLVAEGMAGQPCVHT